MGYLEGLELYLFQETFIPLTVYVVKCLSIQEHYPQVSMVQSPQIIIHEHIDKSYAWCFFDEVVVGDPCMGRSSGILFSTDSLWHQFAANIG